MASAGVNDLAVIVFHWGEQCDAHGTMDGQLWVLSGGEGTIEGTSGEVLECLNA